MISGEPSGILQEVRRCHPNGPKLQPEIFITISIIHYE